MKLRITIEGVSYEVEVEVLDDGSGVSAPTPSPAARSPQAPSGAAAPASSPPASSAAKQPASTPPPASTDENVCRSPIAGTVLEVKVQPGDAVTLNQVLMVVEAMKMETNIAAPTEGTVKAVHVEAGDPVKPGQTLVEFE